MFVTTGRRAAATPSQTAAPCVAIDENNIDAVIFSKADLTLPTAPASLYIAAAAGHGIVSWDDLVLTSGTYDIAAQSHGLSGKDSVRIASSTVALLDTAGMESMRKMRRTPAWDLSTSRTAR